MEALTGDTGAIDTVTGETGLRLTVTGETGEMGLMPTLTLTGETGLRLTETGLTPTLAVTGLRLRDTGEAERVMGEPVIVTGEMPGITSPASTFREKARRTQRITATVFIVGGRKSPM